MGLDVMDEMAIQKHVSDIIVNIQKIHSNNPFDRWNRIAENNAEKIEEMKCTAIKVQNQEPPKSDSDTLIIFNNSFWRSSFSLHKYEIIEEIGYSNPNMINIGAKSEGVVAE